MSYLIAGQATTCNLVRHFLVFHRDLGGQFGQALEMTLLFVLVCFVLVLQLCI